MSKNFEKQLEEVGDKEKFLQAIRDLPEGSGCMIIIEYPDGHDPSHSFKQFGNRTIGESTHLLQTGIFYLHGLYDQDEE